LAWDVTVCTTVVDSYLSAASHAAGAVAKQAAGRKCLKLPELSATYEFQPVAVETHGPLSVSSVSFLVDLGRKITDRSTDFIPVDQCLDSKVQFSPFHETFPVEDDTNT